MKCFVNDVLTGSAKRNVATIANATTCGLSMFRCIDQGADGNVCSGADGGWWLVAGCGGLLTVEFDFESLRIAEGFLLFLCYVGLMWATHPSIPSIPSSFQIGTALFEQGTIEQR